MSDNIYEVGLNVIIPLGGKGERFQKEGYDKPKPLIKMFDKTMIENVLDNLKLNENDKVFIIYQKNLEQHDFSEFIKNKYQNITLIMMDDYTKGACETLTIGIEKIITTFEHNKKTLLLDCDTFYTDDIISDFRHSEINMVFYTKNTNPNPIYSYIKLDSSNNILEIAEKQKISDNANTGCYAFNDINELNSACKYVLDNKITFNNEPYTSCAIGKMLKDKLPFSGKELNKNHVFSVGTPKELNEYFNKTHAFLFDLDGTLVISDDIYLEVWRNILKDYNIDITMDIFKKYIQGNNDKFVLNTLLSNVSIDLADLSRLKDNGFIENIDHILIIDGVVENLSKIKKLGHKCCIVTNCNRRVADKIVDYLHIGEYIDFIIAGDECKYGKPNTEPYLKAIEKYNIPNNKCIIFEDSKTGLLSGKSVNPKYLIGLETLYDSVELKKYGVTSSIKNYIGFDLENITKIGDNEDVLLKIESLISKNMDVEDITLNVNKYKGGFIADVIGFTAVIENINCEYVLKFENSTSNSLSDMANFLKLYEREYYFYEKLSHIVPVKTPKYISLLKDDDGKNLGIVLENMLFKDNFKINLDLNKEDINVSLKIIDRMAKLHSKFWNKPIKDKYPGLKSNDDIIFKPFLNDFIISRLDVFKMKWTHVLSESDLKLFDDIALNFLAIQSSLCGKNTTFIHGDIKSPNLFYDGNNDNEPYFIDWQHCAIGKGVQDLIFLIIESYDMMNIDLFFPIFKHYYYKKLIQYNVKGYTFDEYNIDLLNALKYIPFFTAIWFGSTPNDELIDKNFPYFFIKKFLKLAKLIESS
jgi:beta-phosphoglucomutase-like phosphatase (HAD superfamily)/choline kinase